YVAQSSAAERAIYSTHAQKLVFIRVDSWLLGSMKISFVCNRQSRAVVSVLLCIGAVAAAFATTPQYQIYDIGVIDVGDSASQGDGVSHAGIAVGTSLRTGGSQAFTWTLSGGLVPLPNLSSRSFAVSNSANDKGIAVGTAA